MFENSKAVKRIVSLSAAAVCMLASFKLSPYKVIETDAAEETILTAFEITENMQIGWNLGNTMDATASLEDEDGNAYVPEHAGLETETAWGQPKASQEIIDAIKAKGFNSIRIPTTWFQHLDENNNIDPEWLARVHEVVDYAYKRDMYVIINVHHENWINRKDLLTAYDEIQPRLMKIWEQVNGEFKDYDQHLVFECMNEPRAAGTDWEWWSPTPPAESEVINKLEADFVKLIRESDSPYAKTRLLMLPGYVASADVNIISDLVLPEDDDYIAVSVHAYTPYNFTMNTGKDGYHDEWTTAFRTDLALTLTNLRDTFLDKDIPVVIGEFGSSNFGNTQARIDWATQYITTTKEYGIPCFLWDNDARNNKDMAERHDYMDRRTLEWYEDSVQVVDTMMSIIADDSIVWGSERHKPTYDNVTHQAYEEGEVFLQGPYELDASKDNEAGGWKGSTPGGEGEVSWDKVDGKEVAIKFTGTTPKLAFSDEKYGNWTEVAPYMVDEENGIAYYLMSQAKEAWGLDTALVAHMQAKTTKTTTVDSIVILEAPTGDIPTPEPTAEIHKIVLSGVDRSSSLQFTIEGPAGTNVKGALGYMGATDWEQITYSETVGEDGKLIVTIPLADIPETVTQGEFQIWDNFDIVDMTGYKTVEASGPIEIDGVWGDVDGDGNVKMNDAVLIMQSLSNADRFGLDGTEATHITKEGQLRGDVFEPTGYGSITPQDALRIQEFLLKKVASLAPAAK
ncbi:MAG: cellulase family glycosylhydrolase [Ruminococcus sp.]|nr:cellulase family glycosylhydrolase [Ruminococcus sp.]